METAVFGTIAGSSFGGTGALIGTLILPGIGTAIGAGAGALFGAIGLATEDINKNKKDRERETKEQLEKIILDLTKREQEEKNNLIRYLTIVKEKMSGLEGELNEARQQLNKAVEENKKKEQEDAEEKARIDKEKGEIQKALQSAEKSEIEQLKSERNQLRATSEEQEAFLNR
jgi:hypothetical protein